MVSRYTLEPCIVQSQDLYPLEFSPRALEENEFAGYKKPLRGI
jgi:hypothetical protein